MSNDKKNLKYFLDHPDEMPEDPKELERLTQEHMQAAQEQDATPLTVDRFVEAEEKKDEKAGASSDAKVEDAKDAEAKAQADAKAATEAAAEAAKAAETATAAAAKAEAKPEGILAKDGKNLIPYSQLESARARAAAAEALAKEQAEELAALKAAKKPEAELPDVVMLTPEELEVLEADSPTLAKMLRGQQAALAELRGTVKQLAETQKAQVASEETVVKTEIQSAIDANPTLASWQTADDQTMWNEASKFDRVLRENPKYADVPFAERFAKVVELTHAALGLEAPAQAVVVEQPKLTEAEVKAAAAAKLAEKNKTSKPVSLSQIPGGAPPAVDEKEKVEQMSAIALGNQFLGMTREQMDAYLSNL